MATKRLDHENFTVACPHCSSVVGWYCYTKAGNSTDTHKVRIAAAQALRELAPIVSREAMPVAVDLVDQIIAAQPVRALKEKFTVTGEPLILSTCMKMLGLTIDKSDQGHFCMLPEVDGVLTMYVRTPTGWEYGICEATSTTLDAGVIPESQVLADMIKRFYALDLAAKNQNTSRLDKSIVSSLSTRLLPLVTQAQLDTLRTEIKAIQPAR